MNIEYKTQLIVFLFHEQERCKVQEFQPYLTKAAVAEMAGLSMSWIRQHLDYITKVERLASVKIELVDGLNNALPEYQPTYRLSKKGVEYYRTLPADEVACCLRKIRKASEPIDTAIVEYYDKQLNVGTPGGELVKVLTVKELLKKF